MRFLTSPTTAVNASVSYGVTNSALYRVGSTTATSYRYGGPGAC